MAIESLNEECGVFGIYNPSETVAESIYLGLFALQHRGQESAGIATSNHNKIFSKTDTGLIANVFNDYDVNKLEGDIGIGHTRWATHGEPNNKNAHPHSDISGKFTLVHNGIIENYNSLKKLLADKGIACQTDTDTEVLVQFIAYLYKKKKLSVVQFDSCF